MFKPIEPKNKQFDTTIELQTGKAILNDSTNFPQPILRVYALRVSDKTFIITGGAIKLTHFMEDHPDTNEELEKLDKVRSWLKENGITTQNDLNYCYEPE